jgi:hypothetical protein
VFRRSELLLAVFVSMGLNALAQSAPNVSQVLMWSTMTTRPIVPVTTPGGTFTPTVNGTAVSGTLPFSLLSVYTEKAVNGFSLDIINAPNNYGVANASALSSALSTNIALALSVTPVESPTSGVILKTDPATGAALPVNSTLGPIFTKRAETIGKGKFYIGFTHQNYHFNSFNGLSLNGLSLLYPGGDPSGIPGANGTAPATINLGLDVRIAQDVTFLTYGVTNRFDVSVGLPAVHAAVASRAYNGIIYSGTGLGTSPADKCWCVNTFTPGSFALTAPAIGQSSMSKSGFGDLVVRLKGSVIERPHFVVATGLDLRFPTGDESNYLGTGTTSIKPFVAVSLFSKPIKSLVLAPHMEVGWQYSGKSTLAGQLQGTSQSYSLSGAAIPYSAGPFTATKSYLPSVFSWAVGTEVALNNRNTVIVDILGNQIGWGHGIQTLVIDSRPGVLPTSPGSNGGSVDAAGLVPASGRSSFGQYSGAFGYKFRVAGNLVATVQALTRFDHNGLRADVTPLFGLGYSH